MAPPRRGTALITGASSGIGAELATLCAASGYRLVLVSRQAGRLAEQAANFTRDFGVEARALPIDLSLPSAAAGIFEQTRGDDVQILINNAGFGLRGPFAETDWNVEARLLQVNVTALVELTKRFLPGMIERRSGRVLNVASTAAFVPGPFMAMYYASKAFVFSFSQSVANEVRGTGVTVTVLCPGPTRTGFSQAAGLGDSGVFSGPIMDAGAVAREGYDAMMAGKVEVIAGARNRWLMLGTRLAPRRMLADFTRRLNLGTGN